MRWIKVFLLTVAVLIVILAIAVTLLLNLDFSRLKPEVEQFVERLTGRELTIDGNFALDIGRHTTLHAESVRFSNPEWASDENMVQADRFKLVLDLWSLIDRPILIELIEIDNAQLSLETTDAGKNNWTFGDPTEEKSKRDSGPIPLLLYETRIQNLILIYHGPDLTQPLKVQIDFADQREAADESIDLVIRGNINDRKFDVRAHNNRFGSILSGKDIDYTLEARFDTLNIKSAGHLDDIANLPNATLSLQVKGPEVNDITSMLGLPEFASGNLDIIATIHPGARGIDAEIKGNLGQLQIDASGTLDDATRFEQFRFDVESNGKNLGRVVRIFGIDGIPDEQFELSGHVERSGSTLTVKDTALKLDQATFSLDGSLTNFPNLDGAELTLDISGSDIAQFRELIGLPGAAEGSFELIAKLDLSEQGAERLDVRGTTNLGEINIKGPIGNPPDFVGTRLTVEASGPALQRLGAAWGIPNLIQVPFELSGELEVTDAGLITLKNWVAKAGGDRLELDGVLGKEPLRKDTDLNFRYKGRDLARAVAMAGVTENVPSEAFELSGRYGARSSGYQLDDVEFTIGQDQLGFNGVIGEPPKLIGTDIRVKVSGPDLAAALEMAGLKEGIPQQAYDIGGRLRVESNGYRLDNVDANIGRAKIDLDGLVGEAPTFVGTDVKISAKGPDLEEVLADTITFDVPAGPFSVAAKAKYQAEKILLEDVNITAGGATVTGDADIGLPIQSGGRFKLDANGPDIRVLLPNFELYKPDPSSFAVDADGSWKGERWTFEKLSIELDDASLHLKGELDQPPDWSATELELQVQAGSLAKLGLINGRRLPPKPFQLTANFSGNETRFEMHELIGHLGGGDFTGKLSVDLEDIPKIDIEFDSDALDLRPIMAIMEPKAPAEPTEPSDPSELDQSDQMLIPEWDFRLDELRKINGSAVISVDDFIVRATRLNDLQIEAELADGNLTVSRASAKGARGSFTSKLKVIQEDSDTARIWWGFEGSEVSFDMLDETAEEERVAPVYDAKIAVSGSGRNWHELAESLNGAGQITSGGGQLPNSRTLILFGSFFNEILQSINPFSVKDPYTEVSCLVLVANVTDGVIIGDPGFVLQTDKINAASFGHLDLSTEKLDMNFRTAPRSRLSISAGELINPYIKVTGTLSEPRLTMDKKGTLITGGVAVATMGLSILATTAWDRAFRSKDPCGDALKESSKKKGDDGSIQEKLDSIMGELAD